MHGYTQVHWGSCQSDVGVNLSELSYQDFSDLINQILAQMMDLLVSCEHSPFPSETGNSSPTKAALPPRTFPYKGFPPEQNKETDLLSYLCECYDRALLEERISPRVGVMCLW